MFIQLINYKFKGMDQKKQGLEFIKSQLIPNEKEKFGFFSYHLFDGSKDDIFLMYRYKVKENCFGSPIDKEAYEAFKNLWRETPSLVAGPNYASPKFQNLPEKGL